MSATGSVTSIEKLPLTFLPMVEVYAREIVDWQYDDPYSLYNVTEGNGTDSEVDARDRLAREQGIKWLVNPHNRYFAALDETGALFGFCCFGHDARVPGGEYQRDVGADVAPGAILDVGLGMHPAWTGQGHGTAFLQAILSFAREEMQAICFRATIAGFNRRSQRVFAKAGFKPVRTFVSELSPPLEFVVMRTGHCSFTCSRPPFNFEK